MASENESKEITVSDGSGGLSISIVLQESVPKLVITNQSFLTTLFHCPTLLLHRKEVFEGDKIYGSIGDIVECKVLHDVYSVLRSCDSAIYFISCERREIDVFIEGQYLGFMKKPMNFESDSDFLLWLEGFLHEGS